MDAAWWIQDKSPESVSSVASMSGILKSQILVCVPFQSTTDAARPHLSDAISPLAGVLSPQNRRGQA